MKILYITPYPPRKDGIADYSARLVETIRAKSASDNEVEIYSFKRDGTSTRNQHSLISSNPLSWMKIYSQIRGKRPDIIHVQFDISNYFLNVIPLFLVLVMIKRHKDIKLVTTYHEAYRDKELYGILAVFFYNIFSRPFDRVYVHSRLSEKRLVSSYGVSPKKILCIDHGTYTFSSKKKNHDELRKRYEVGKRDVVLSFGYIYKLKGIEYLIEAIALLKSSAQVLPVVLIAGEVPKRSGIFRIFQFRNERYLAKLKQAVQEAGLEEDIKFIGYIDKSELYSLFTLAKIVVLSYTNVDQSSVLNIAIAAKTPAIASNIGGISEALNGVGVVPPCDAQAIANQLTKILGSHQVLDEMRQYYSNLAVKFSTEAVIDNLLKDYAALLADADSNIRSRANLNVLLIAFDAVQGKYDAETMHTKNLADAIGDHIAKVTLIITGKRLEYIQGKKVQQVITRAPKLEGGIAKKILILIMKNIRFYRNAIHYGKQADVVYERHNPASQAGLLASWRLRKPLYYEINSLGVEETMSAHNVNSKLIHSFFHHLTQFQLLRAKAVFVQTEELKKIMLSNYRIREIIVVPNGANAMAKRPIEKRNRTKKDRVRFVYLGTIDEYHKLEGMLDAFAQLRDKAYLTVIGTGSRLNELISQYKKNSNIEFCGSLPQKEALKALQENDIGIAQYNLSSPLFKRYGFYFCPLKLLEYSAAGIPTVIIGQSNSFVKNFEDVNACVVISDPLQLEAVVTDLHNNPRNMLEMSQGAYKISREFSWDRAALKTLKAING